IGGRQRLTERLEDQHPFGSDVIGSTRYADGEHEQGSGAQTAKTDPVRHSAMLTGNVLARSWPRGRGSPLPELHDVVGITAFNAELGHVLHRAVDMGEESAVAGGQVVQPGFPVGCLDEAIAWAFPVAGEQHRALLAVSR